MYATESMNNEETAIRFADNILGMLKQLEPAELRLRLKQSFGKTADKVRNAALSHLHAVNVDVQGDRADWDASLRSHVYSGGGGFLLSVRGRAGKRGSGEGEKSMHKNRFFGKYKRKLPILQWIEFGTKDRQTKGFRRKSHRTGSISGAEFLRKAEPGLVAMAQQEVVKDLHSVIDDVIKTTI